MNSQFSLHQLHIDGDKIMTVVCWVLFLFSFSLAAWHDTWVPAIVVGLPAAIVPTLLANLLPGSRVTRYAMATSFMTFCALHIHQGHGLVELHFGIFALLAFLVYYRDWSTIVVGAAVTAVHHVLFNYLQGADAGVFVFSQGASWSMVLVHAAYVVFESGVLIYLSLRALKEALPISTGSA